tara:strand:+ start:1374 stop:1937 length:564 start_codon:yes stop_codon:yes gene_type:complete
VGLNEVAPPGFGHTKSGDGEKKGGTAAAFKRALEDGRFKGLPGSKTKKEKTADMFKLMYSMKKKGYKPHYKPGTDKKYKKYQESDENKYGVPDPKSPNNFKKLPSKSNRKIMNDVGQLDFKSPTNEDVSYKDYTRKAQDAMDRIKKDKEERSKKNAESARKDRMEKGVRFYDKKGKGYIKSGRKVYT